MPPLIPVFILGMSIGALMELKRHERREACLRQDEKDLLYAMNELNRLTGRDFILTPHNERK